MIKILVKPYYKPPIRPTSKANRHILWSNLSIAPVKVDLVSFTDIKNSAKSLREYHDIPREVAKLIPSKKRRDCLRDMVHHEIAYNIAKQVIPQVIRKKIYNQTKLFQSIK